MGLPELSFVLLASLIFAGFIGLLFVGFRYLLRLTLQKELKKNNDGNITD